MEHDLSHTRKHRHKPRKALKKYASTKQSRKDDIDIVDHAVAEDHYYQLTVIRRLESYRKSGKLQQWSICQPGWQNQTAIRFVVNTLLTGQAQAIWFAAQLLEQASEEFNEAWKVSGDRNVASIRYYGNADIDASQASKNDTIILFKSFQKLRAKTTLVLIIF